MKKLEDLEIHLNYPGCHEDVAGLKRTHVEYPSLFDGELEQVRKKQMLHIGLRNHPQIKKLDSLKPLTYPGWQKDWDDAEENHMK